MNAPIGQRGAIEPVLLLAVTLVSVLLLALQYRIRLLGKEVAARKERFGVELQLSSALSMRLLQAGGGGVPSSMEQPEMDPEVREHFRLLSSSTPVIGELTAAHGSRVSSAVVAFRAEHEEFLVPSWRLLAQEHSPCIAWHGDTGDNMSGMRSGRSCSALPALHRGAHFIAGNLTLHTPLRLEPDRGGTLLLAVAGDLHLEGGLEIAHADGATVLLLALGEIAISRILSRQTTASRLLLHSSRSSVVVYRRGDENSSAGDELLPVGSPNSCIEPEEAPGLFVRIEALLPNFPSTRGCRFTRSGVFWPNIELLGRS